MHARLLEAESVCEASRAFTSDGAGCNASSRRELVFRPLLCGNHAAIRVGNPRLCGCSEAGCSFGALQNGVDTISDEGLAV